MTNKDSINIQGTVYEPRAPKASPTLATGDLFNSRYEIIRELGQGGMGVAYLVNDTLSKEEVVLKIIHPSLVDDKARDRMIAEGVMTRKIRNPKIVSVYDVNEVDGQLFLAMEYVQGETLRNWMQNNMVKNINAPLEHIVRIVQEILAGLAAAHDSGVIHRDLKPENIMISGDPGSTDFKLKILDFGIATGIKTEVFTSSVASIGTPLYMAPEQMTSPNAVKASADIYSIGRLFYEMLMDVLPDGTWHAPSEIRSDIPEALDKVLHKALQPPRFRYQSATEFSAAILEAVSGNQVSDILKMAWTSAGAEAMLGKLKQANAHLYQQLLSDKPTGPSQQGQSEPAPPLQNQGDHSEIKEPNNAVLKYIGIGVAGLIGFIVIAATAVSVVSEFDGGGGNTTGGFVSTTESWRLDEGGVIRMTLSNGRISGTGVVAPMGPVDIQGDPTTGQLMVYSNGGYVADIIGTLAPGQGGNDFSGQVWSSGQVVRPIMFHIDH